MSALLQSQHTGEHRSDTTAAGTAREVFMPCTGSAELRQPAGGKTRLTYEKHSSCIHLEADGS